MVQIREEMAKKCETFATFGKKGHVTCEKATTAEEKLMQQVKSKSEAPNEFEREAELHKTHQ